MQEQKKYKNEKSKAKRLTVIYIFINLIKSNRMWSKPWGTNGDVSKTVSQEQCRVEFHAPDWIEKHSRCKLLMQNCLQLQWEFLNRTFELIGWNYARISSLLCNAFKFQGNQAVRLKEREGKGNHWRKSFLGDLDFFSENEKESCVVSNILLLTTPVLT